MKINPNAELVLKKRYLEKNDKGEPIETGEGLFRRVADAIAAADGRYEDGEDTAALADEFYDMMTNLEFLPNSPH